MILSVFKDVVFAEIFVVTFAELFGDVCLGGRKIYAAGTFVMAIGGDEVDKVGLHELFDELCTLLFGKD